MQVQQINNNYNYNFKQPSFQGYKREVIKPIVGLLYRNDTWFFRDVNFWAKLTTYLTKLFENEAKVNIYSYGCSDGSEPFTFAMRMLSMHEKDAPKFLPVIARDIDKEMLKRIADNNYSISQKEKDCISHFTNDQYNRFFIEPYGDNCNNKNDYRPFPVFVRSELYDNVDFDIGNIFNDYKKLKPKNTVLLARNFWPYIYDKYTRLKFFKNLYKHFDKNSILVIGEYDERGTNYKIKNEILDAGFSTTPIEWVYIKNEEKSKIFHNFFY